jgi:hypothetical protein
MPHEPRKRIATLTQRCAKHEDRLRRVANQKKIRATWWIERLSSGPDIFSCLMMKGMIKGKSLDEEIKSDRETESGREEPVKKENRFQIRRCSGEESSAPDVLMRCT